MSEFESRFVPEVRCSALRSEYGIKMKPAKATDRRPERTRQALMTAFIDLILERGYEAVTVDEVVRRANIGRSTLYAYFGGLHGLLKQSLTGPSTRLANLVDHHETAETLVPLLVHFWDQRRRNKAFFVPPIRGLWARRLAELIEPRLNCIARRERRPDPVLPWNLIATQIADSQIGLVGNWLTSGWSASPDAIAGALIGLTRATVDGLVSPASNPGVCGAIGSDPRLTGG